MPSYYEHMQVYDSKFAASLEFGVRVHLFGVWQKALGVIGAFM